MNLRPLTSTAVWKILAEDMEVDRRQAQGVDVTDLEALLTMPWGFDLSTATPVQRAVCKVAQGKGLTAPDAAVIKALGGCSVVDPIRPESITFLAAIRGGKSKLVSAAAIWATQVVDVSNIGQGEIPRLPIVSVKTDLARVVFNYIKSYVIARPELKRLLVREPTANTVVLRHPSGVPIEIVVTAGHRAGATLVARWLVGCIFDEAPRMMGQEEGIINLDDALASIRGRVLPGGIIWKVGSPWAPFGPIHTEFVNHWGTPDTETVIFKAPGPDVNPIWWTPERCAEEKRKDPDAYASNVLAEFGQSDTGMYNTDLLMRCSSRKEVVLKPDPLMRYVAAMDPATRGNSWALVIAAMDHNGVVRVALAKEWTGTKKEPLSPRKTLEEVKETMKPYNNLRTVFTDQWSSDALKDIGYEVGLSIVDEAATQKSNVEQHEGTRQLMLDDRLDLPPLQQLRADLAGVRKKLTQQGVAVELTGQGNGRHCDLASALARCVGRQMPRPAAVPSDLDIDKRMRQLAIDRKKKQEKEGGWQTK